MKASGEDDEDDEKDGNKEGKDTDMQIDQDSSCHDSHQSVLDLKSNDIIKNDDDDDNLSDKSEERVDTDIDADKKGINSQTVEGELEDISDDKMSVGDLDVEKSQSKDCENKDKKGMLDCDEKVYGDSDGKENCDSMNIGEQHISDSDVEMEVKRELREAVEIRIPKVRSMCEINEYKWMSSSANGDHSITNERPETPPLQKLMRQDFSPLKLDHKSPTPAKKMKEKNSSSHDKEGFTSKLASVIVPSTSVPIRTASHPKQLLSHSLVSLRSSSLKPVNYSKHVHSSSSFPSRHYQPSKQLFKNPVDNDQPLDLSNKSSKETRDRRFSDSSNSTHKSSSNFTKPENGRYLPKHDNGMSSTSLQSLQQKFGGDYHLRGLRKPTNYMLFGPEIPALHQALLHSASMSLPPQILPMSNGAQKLKPEQGQSYRHRNSTPPSPSHKIKSEEKVKSLKKEETLTEKSMKREKSDKAETETLAASDDNPQSEKYTNHMCTCGKWYDNLYSLSLHLQETGHLPARSKSVSLLEYPKLVRGQDMWLNQESEQTRRILRCIQCGESFRTLPMLTVHMMKTQHYTKIVSSEHARRAHKCSAYCDKEQDKECVFKCKVCQDTFSDMEGLANHMILSGHHKKQTSRPPPTFGDLQQYRQKRKRLYSFEENLNPYGNPALAAMLDYKRKYLPEQSSPDPCMDNDDSDEADGSTISCENCGKRIETKLFVGHVRACLGQKLAEDIRRDIEKVSKEVRDKSERIKNEEKLTEERENMRSPTKKRKLERLSPNLINCENKCGENEQERKKLSPHDDSHVQMKQHKVSNRNEESITENHLNSVQCKDTNHKSIQKLDSTNSKTVNIKESENKKEIASNEDESREIQAPASNRSSSPDENCVNGVAKTENGPIKKENGNDEGRFDSEQKKASFLSKKLDIIDPDNMKEEGSGGSALSAMESFIQKSFSNKFDYKKGNIIISPHSGTDATIHSRPLASVMNMDSMDYLSKYTKFYSALNLPNGFGSEALETERKKSKHYRNNEDETLKDVLTMKKEKDRRLNSSSPYSSQGDKDDGRASVKSCLSDGSGSLDKNENLEKKYLNMSEIEDQDTKAKAETKSSALDSLSSFVYGQPMTSEHPLDSLQRLITKADIPSLMSTHGARAFKYLPPHLQFHHQSNSDLTVPLNLTVKSQIADSDDDDDRLRPEDESLSDYEAASSPANSDGDPMEYRCTACSRKFASKGSYRYHLSRCHLSSVKRYGIKEAFNMSPYVYLPLDHTAKFSKYYEMARELANKRK